MAKPFRLSICQLVDELLDQLDNLRADVVAFEAGVFTKYKGMSVILRTLLTGSSNSQPLTSAILPDATFAPLKIIPAGNVGCDHLVTPADIVIWNNAGGKLHYLAGSRLRFLGIEDGGVVVSEIGPIGGDVTRRTSITGLFNPIGARLELGAWLLQPFLRPDWSLSQFLKLIAHKDGGAHLEDNERVALMKDAGNLQAHLTCAISRHVEYEIRYQLHQAFPKHVRAVR